MDLTLPLKAEYFDAIKAGTKTEEYRLTTPFWRKRIEGRTFDHVILTKGYPSTGDLGKRLKLPWRGYSIKTITHPHFGSEPVEVFAIRVAGPALPGEEQAHEHINGPGSIVPNQPGRERAFRIRGEPGRVLVSDERWNPHRKIGEGDGWMHFRSIMAAMLWIMEELMQEPPQP